MKLAAKKTSLRSLSVGRVGSTEVAGAFSGFPYCRALPHLPRPGLRLFETAIAKGMAGKVSD